MQWGSRGVVVVLCFWLIISIGSIEGRKKKERKFDGDFEFADEEESKTTRKEGKKTWIMDPGSDLCQALKCKKKELCLLENQFTAICVNKKELHKNGDVILPKSKVEGKAFSDDEKDLYEDEDEDSDYYDDEDSVEDVFSKGNKKSEKSLANAKSSSIGTVGNNGEQGESNFKSCSPCPVVKPTFICGSDNRTYSSLCRMDYHNCIQNSQVVIGCKGFCPCKGPKSEPKKAAASALDLQKKQWGSNSKNSKLYQSKVSAAASASGRKQNKFVPKIGFGQSNDDRRVYVNDFASGNPVSTSFSAKDRYSKYKDYYGYKTAKSDKSRSHNEVINVKPPTNRDCNEEALESMGNRLLDWFSVVMVDTQKRKLNKFSIDHFPRECKREVQFMFSHLNTEDDGQLSLQELYDLENDRNEKCIKPFLDRCDSDKDIFISPREWCDCFAKCRGVKCSSNERNNELDDDEDSDVESSGDGSLD